MSQITNEIDKVRAIIKHYDDSKLTASWCLALIREQFMKSFFKDLEEGQDLMSIGSCCCANHPPDRTFKVEFTIEPHGFRAKRIEST